MYTIRIRLDRIIGLLGLLFLGLQLWAAHARAWGLSTDLNSAWVHSALVNTVIQRREIDYCIEIQDPRFAPGTIQRQVAAALSLWLKPLEDLGITGVTLREVNCADGTFNLKVLIGPDTDYPQYGSYQLPKVENDHYYSLVKVDSGFSSLNKGKSYSFVDFENFVPAGRSIDSVMYQISVQQPMTVAAFAASRSFDYYAVYWSTYRVFIHEVGHSFGLCDTYASQIQVHCDPARMTDAQPSSVMKDSSYFYLMPDDIAGIKALFSRFLQ